MKKRTPVKPIYILRKKLIESIEKIDDTALMKSILNMLSELSELEHQFYQDRYERNKEYKMLFFEAESKLTDAENLLLRT